jgi:DNA primase
MPAPRPAWRLPELLAAPLEREVLVTEGERAASVALRLGFEATCSAMGAGSARRTCWSWATGRLIVISVDHDAAGEAYGRDVAELCLKAGARVVKIIRLADVWRDAPAGADLADLASWPRLRSEQEAIGVIERLIAMAKEVRP